MFSDTSDGINTIAWGGGKFVGGNSIDVYWNYASNAISYDVYVQQEVKGWDTDGNEKTYNRTVHVGSRTYLSCSVPTRNATWITNSEKIRFGVTASDFDGNHVASKIRWSEYITIFGGIDGLDLSGL